MLLASDRKRNQHRWAVPIADRWHSLVDGGMGTQVGEQLEREEKEVRNNNRCDPAKSYLCTAHT